LQNENDSKLEFPDHHDFNEKDIEKIEKSAQNKIIITTEKDYMRLQHKIKTKNLFYLPIKTKIIDDEAIFNQLIVNYLVKN
jgi:tetraacyldisaccharide 4'-kinase